MAERTVHVPEQEWLSDSQAAAWLGLHLKTFTKLVRDGRLPPGTRWTKRTVRWRWDVIWAAGVLMAAGFLVREGEELPDEEN